MDRLITNDIKQPKYGDFAKASFTAVISDLHLCEQEATHPKYPLWKKYKTEEFFFDEIFRAFLKELEQKSQGETIELILNGDIFDFDSVTDLPDSPTYRITWLERRRGLHPQAEKSMHKIEKILADHPVWVRALREFIVKGNRVIFIIGNHDLELHFLEVQNAITKALDLTDEQKTYVRFNEWFYISNGDTLIEHGNQYDPYCMAQDPVNPFIQRFNRIEVRVPFGNLATRYMINGMGFFNPHVDTNFIMSAKEYVVFFYRYMLRAQPLILFSWLWGATVTMIQSSIDRLRPSIRSPLTIEDRIEDIALRANATPRMVRELQELFVAPAASYPTIIMKELWLDRAFLIVLASFGIFQVFISLKSVYSISFFWMFIPLFLFLPFFLFYSKAVSSEVVEYKEPKEKVLSMTSVITKVNRVIYGHTHIERHEIIGAVEHLNCGTWSPAFADVECKKPVGKKTYVWLAPGPQGVREAKLLEFKDKGHTKVQLLEESSNKNLVG